MMVMNMILNKKIQMKNKKQKKQEKDGDLDNNYYSSLWLRKSGFYKKSKVGNASFALAMLDSMKTHAGDEAYRNLKNCFIHLNILQKNN